MKKKQIHMTCCIILKRFQTIELFESSDPGTDEIPRGLSPGYIAGYGRRLTPSRSISRSVSSARSAGAFEKVLMFSTGESFSPTQDHPTQRLQIFRK